MWIPNKKEPPMLCIFCKCHSSCENTGIPMVTGGASIEAPSLGNEGGKIVVKEDGENRAELPEHILMEEIEGEEIGEEDFPMASQV